MLPVDVRWTLHKSIETRKVYNPTLRLNFEQHAYEYYQHSNERWRRINSEYETKGATEEKNVFSKIKYVQWRRPPTICRTLVWTWTEIDPVSSPTSVDNDRIARGTFASNILVNGLLTPLAGCCWRFIDVQRVVLLISLCVQLQYYTLLLKTTIQKHKLNSIKFQERNITTN